MAATRTTAGERARKRWSPITWARRLFSSADEDGATPGAEAADLTPPPPWSAVALAGRWAVTGFLPDGRRYGGVVTVQEAGEGYAVHWRLTEGAFAGQTFKGFGVASAKSFAVAFQGGVALYDATPDGRLAGAWSAVKSRKLFNEVWARPQEI